MDVYDSYSTAKVTINQYKYPYLLYKLEVRTHELVLHEYGSEVFAAMQRAISATRPNVRLLRNQPYLNGSVRYRLVDFALKMLVRLKILPFVFCRAVRLFDRYCLRRIVLLEQAQLIITTCLWLAAKIHGGNSHFANLHGGRLEAEIATIADLGYGLGARFKGPTERYRIPKLRELIKICGLKCNYTADMFKEMELHIMSVMEWQLTEPTIEEYFVSSHELKVTSDEPMEAKLIEFFRIKQMMAYAACYLYELVGYDALELAAVIVELVNDTFSLQEKDTRSQTLNQTLYEPVLPAPPAHAHIRRHLLAVLLNAPPYLLLCFNTRGPQLLCLLLASYHGLAAAVDCPYSRVLSSASSGTQRLLSDAALSNYTYTSAESTPLRPFVARDFLAAMKRRGVCPPGAGLPPRLLEALFLMRYVAQKCRPAGVRTPTAIHDSPTLAAAGFGPPQVHAAFLKTNSSLLSLRLALSRDTDIFDHSKPLGTPVSSDDDYKPVHPRST